MEVILILVWIIYIWLHLIIVDWLFRWLGSKTHPWVKKIHPSWADLLAILVVLSWFTFIGAAISGWIGLIPAFVIYLVTKPFAK